MLAAPRAGKIASTTRGCRSSREPLDRVPGDAGAGHARSSTTAGRSNQRYAFWINTYNAFTVHLIVKNYPLDSIRDLGTIFSKVWDKRFIPLSALSIPRARTGTSRSTTSSTRSCVPSSRTRACTPRSTARRSAARPCGRAPSPPRTSTPSWTSRRGGGWPTPSATASTRTRRTRWYVSAIFRWFSEDFERDGGLGAPVDRPILPGRGRGVASGKDKVKRKYVELRLVAERRRAPEGPMR